MRHRTTRALGVAAATLLLISAAGTAHAQQQKNQRASTSSRRFEHVTPGTLRERVDDGVAAGDVGESTATSDACAGFLREAGESPSSKQQRVFLAAISDADDTTTDRDQTTSVDLRWHFPDSVPLECVNKFRVDCAPLADASLGDRAVRRSTDAGAVQTLPLDAKGNAGVLRMRGLEGGRLYGCALTAGGSANNDVGDANGGDATKAQIASSVRLVPGFPKLLKDTASSRGDGGASGGGAKVCDEGAGDYGMVNRTAVFARNGCGGVFLLPNDIGVMCQSTKSSYVECVAPGFTHVPSPSLPSPSPSPPLGDERESQSLPDLAKGSTAANGEGSGGGSGGGRAGDALRVVAGGGDGKAARRCRRGETFGFASPQDLFVLNGCRGTFELTLRKGERNEERKGDWEGERKGEGEGLLGAALSNRQIAARCDGDALVSPGYAQRASTRRWWCLFLCETSTTDPNGFFKCPLPPIRLPPSPSPSLSSSLAGPVEETEGREGKEGREGREGQGQSPAGALARRGSVAADAAWVRCAARGGRCVLPFSPALLVAYGREDGWRFMRVDGREQRTVRCMEPWFVLADSRVDLLPSSLAEEKEKEGEGEGEGEGGGEGGESREEESECMYAVALPQGVPPHQDGPGIIATMANDP